MNIDDSKKAIKAASDFYKIVIPAQQATDIRVEGIEKVKKNYKVTLSCPEAAEYLFADKKRHYNIFMIDGKTFEMVSMNLLEDKNE